MADWDGVARAGYRTRLYQFDVIRRIPDWGLIPGPLGATTIAAGAVPQHQPTAVSHICWWHHSSRSRAAPTLRVDTGQRVAVPPSKVVTAFGLYLCKEQQFTSWFSVQSSALTVCHWCSRLACSRSRRYRRVVRHPRAVMKHRQAPFYINVSPHFKTKRLIGTRSYKFPQTYNIQGNPRITDKFA